LAILGGMQLYSIFFPANSANRAPMVEQNGARQIDDFRGRFDQFMRVVDGLQASIKSQNETIAELRAKNEQQSKEVNSWILKRKIIFINSTFIIRFPK
jgi:hypothetical protein